MTKLTDTQIAKLEDLGGSRWTKNDKDRLYFNAVDLGLEVEHYKSGSIRYAFIGDERISNAEAGRLMACKFWVDVATGEAHAEHRGGDEDNFAILASAFESIAAEAVAE